MKKVFLATAVVSAVAISPALAADIPRKAPVTKAPVAQQVASWTGCYVGAGGGYGMWNQDSSIQSDPTFGPVTVFSSTTTSGGRGYFGTVGAGCDYQLSDRWVIGAFADYDFSGIKGDLNAPVNLTVSGEEKLRSSWAVGGRIGYLVTPEILSYFTGGFTQARFSRVDLVIPANPPSPFGWHAPATSYSGWFLGGGTEIMLSPNWSIRNEYRYARYNNEFVPFLDSVTGARTTFGADSEKVVQTVRTGLVWKWNRGARVAQAPMPQPAANWSGCHVGAGGGYGMWNQDSNYQSDPTFGPVTVTGIVTTSGGRGYFGTVGGGCDYQLSDRWVIGAFADYDFSDIKGDYLNPVLGWSGEEKLRSSWAAGGRIGYVVTPAILSYFAGGYTQAHFSRVALAVPSNPPFITNFHMPATDYSGWFLGGGTEIMVAPSWFVRSEYRYARYDIEFVPYINNTTGARINEGSDIQKFAQTIRTELVWKWNWGGPVRAAY